MRAVNALSLVFLGGSVVCGCHSLAGVRTDGVLDTDSGGNGGAGGVVTCNPDDCVSKTCDQGACVPVKAACLPEGSPFNVFLPPEVTKPDVRLLVTFTSNTVYVAISEESGPTAKFRVRSIDGALVTTLSSITDCTIAAPKAKMLGVRATNDEFVLQGYEIAGNDSTMSEISFPLNPTTGELVGGCVSQPMVSWPACVDHIQTAHFARIGDVTKYAVTCAEQANSSTWHLVTGGSDEATYTDVANAPSTDPSVRVVGFTYIKNERLFILGPKISGQHGYRRESDNFALHPLDLSADPERYDVVLGLLPIVAGESAYIVMGSALLPPAFDANLLGGVLTDINQLDAVPPTGFKLVGNFSGSDVSKIGIFGTGGQDETSYYAGVAPLSQKSADLYWLAKTGELLVPGQSAYVVPSGDPTIITRVAFVPLGSYFRLALWREENAGAVTIRARKYVCSYSL